MLFDIDAMDVKPRYNLLSSLIVPRPIAWVTTVDAAGRVNAAPFSFFNLMAGTPPVVVLGIGNRDGAPKDTARNIVDTGEFVINLVTAGLLDAMNVTAVDFDADVDEISEAGLETVASHAVVPPGSRRARLRWSAPSLKRWPWGRAEIWWSAPFPTRTSATTSSSTNAAGMSTRAGWTSSHACTAAAGTPRSPRSASTGSPWRTASLSLRMSRAPSRESRVCRGCAEGPGGHAR